MTTWVLPSRSSSSSAFRHRQAVRCADVKSFGAVFALHQCHCLAVSVPGSLVTFERGHQRQMRRLNGERRGKATELFRMVQREQFSAEDGDLRFARQFVSKQFGCHRSTDVSMDGHRTDTFGIGCIAAHAHHRRAASRELANQRVELPGVAGKKDHSVVALSQCGFDRVGVSRANTRILMKLQIDLHSNHVVRCGANAGAQRVEEVGDVFWQNHAN